MYLTKAVIAISSTGGAAGTGDFNSLVSVSGLLYAVGFVASTETTAAAGGGALPTTATISLRQKGSTGVAWLDDVSCTTDDWMLLPRTAVCDTTGASSAWNSTAYVPAQFPSVDTITASIAGASCADLAGAVEVYMEGG